MMSEGGAGKFTLTSTMVTGKIREYFFICKKIGFFYLLYFVWMRKCLVARRSAIATNY